MAQIDGQKALEEWLEGRDSEVAATIACRAALRVLPLVSENWQNENYSNPQTAVVLPTLRACLVSSTGNFASNRVAKTATDGLFFVVATVAYASEAARSIHMNRPSRSINAAANAVAASHFLRDSSGDVISDSTGQKMLDSGAHFASSVFWKSVDEDRHALDEGKSIATVMNLPLWFGNEIPVDLLSPQIHLYSFFARDPATWSFWFDWYQRVLDGAHQNQKLLYDVALIPNEDWEEGPEHIAGLIRDLQAKHLAAATPIAEKIMVRETTGLIYAVPVAMPRAGQLESILDQISDALGDALGVNRNGLREEDLATVILQRTLSKYRDVPWRVHQDCVRALEALEAEINAGNLPEGDPRLEALRRTLIDSAVGIRTAIPEVKEQFAAELQTRFEELPEEPRGQVVVAVRYTIDLAEPEFAADARDDAALIESRVASLEQKDALYRQSGRLSRIAVMATVGGIAFGAATAVSNSAIDQGVAALLYQYRWGQYQDVPLPPPVATKPVATQKPPATGG